MLKENEGVPLYNEALILFILASVQFTHIMDFVIMMPMNPIFQEVFSIDNKKFGILVSAYAASAGVSGFFTFFFIDRLDRKKALIALYTGFAIGTIGCAVAQDYYFFLVARIVSGAFGGVLGALILAIVGDVFPENRRGRATGVVMASFSVASIIGIPLGLYLAVKVDWHFPFYLIAGLSFMIILISLKVFPQIPANVTSGRIKPFQMLSEVFTNPDRIRALLFMSVLMLSGFSVIPFISDYMVSNVGFSTDDLKYIYLIGGSFTVVSGPLIGRLADKFGKRKIFIIVACLSIVPILLITNLPQVSFFIAYFVTTLFFIFFGGRFVPAMSMLTSSVNKSKRGGFMSISNSFQQLSSALAAFIAGLIIGEKTGETVQNFWMVGIFSVAMTIICILLSFKVKQVEE